MTPTANTQPWPYPFWIAHRGAGLDAPENTLAAISLGAKWGFKMFECDVKLSSDGIAYLLHDDGLERTTNAHARSSHAWPINQAKFWPWKALSQLDAGAWHSAEYAGHTLPTLEQVANLCAQQQLLVNLELKPCPGLAYETGVEVAKSALALWLDSHSLLCTLAPPLLSSFEPDSLNGAREAAPDLPRALLSEWITKAVLKQALDLGCCALVLHYTQWSPEWVQRCQKEGLRTLCYTVNDNEDVKRLQAMGIEGIITDDIQTFSPLKRESQFT